MARVRRRFFAHYRCLWCQDLPGFWHDRYGEWFKGACPVCQGRNLVIETVKTTPGYF